ncbi:type I 3-dehydroquinate dehydratase [Chloroflexota bacterium]
MRKPRICAVIMDNNPEAIKEVEPQVDLFEVRIDFIGDDWQGLVKQLKKPWIACNRSSIEGGRWRGSEARRIEGILQAIELGADTVDIELSTENLGNIVKLIKKRARCLISSHNMEKTPPLDEMKETVQRQLNAGADICKIVTTAREFADNLTVLQLISEFSGVTLISFAMGALGTISRVLCPLAGGDFTYAAIEQGKETAQGQITVRELTRIYEIIRE